MLDKAQSRPDLLLLLSLVAIILVYPLLDHGELRRLLLGILMFVPIILASVRLSQIKGWVWPSVLLMTSVLVTAVISTVYPQPLWLAIKWALMTAFFGLTVIGLFSFLKNARTVSQAHLYTAVSIYLLLGLQWFALYSAIEGVYPGAILHSSARADRQSELLYFSLVTLSTIGYGDVVPVYGEVRMLAALEGVAGVLYVAITVAILVSAYKQQNASH
jgi:hypothetical protein